MTIGMVAALRAVIYCERPRPHGLGLPLWRTQRTYLLATMLGTRLQVGLPTHRPKMRYPDPLDSVLYGYTLGLQPTGPVLVGITSS